jgi:hypothetical protein
MDEQPSNQDLNNVIARMLEGARRAFGLHKGHTPQRPVQKPPKVSEMNARQLAAHKKRLRRQARNRALQEDRA